MTITFARTIAAIAFAFMAALPIAARAQEAAAPSTAAMPPTEQPDVAANDDSADSPPPPATDTPAPLPTPVPAASAAPTVAPSPAPSVAGVVAPTPAASPATVAANPSATISPGDGKVISPTSGFAGLFGASTSPAAASGSTRGGSPTPNKPTEPPSATSLAFSFLALLGFCALGLLLMRRRLGFSVPGVKGQRKLVVSETRALGNRQFLLVVEYENQRVLLGVTPGKIDYLCELTPPVSAATPEAGAAPATKEEDYGALLDQTTRRQTSSS